MEGATDKTRRTCLRLFALAVVVRVAFVVALGTHQPDPTDDHWQTGWESGRIAWHLAEGRGFSLAIDPSAPDDPTPTAWLAPLYPSLMAGVFRVFGSFSVTSIVVILGIQILASALTSVVLYLVGTRAASPRAGLIAGILFALAPSALNVSARVIWSTSLLTCLALVCVLLLQRQAQRRSLGGAAKIGIVMGLMLLTSPAVALFFPAAALWLLRRRGKRALSEIAVLVVVSIVVITPWIVRNQMVFGRLFFLKSNFGHELFVGNNPWADGSYHRAVEFTPRVFDEETNARLWTSGEMELNDALGEAARNHIRDDPAGFLRLSADRTKRFWADPFVSNWESLPGSGPLLRATAWIYRLGCGVILVLGALGVVLAVRRRTEWGLPLAFLVMYPIPYLITHVSISRYRFPVVPFLLLFAAFAASEAIRKLRGGATEVGPPGANPE